MHLIALYVFLFFFSFFLSTVLNFIFLRFASTLGIRGDVAFNSRWSTTSKPALGGITFFIIMLLALVLVRFFIEGTFFSGLKLLGVFMAMILAFLTGFFDDAFDTKPFVKFSSQVLCGLILVLTGNTINIFPSEMANFLLTVFWVVAMMNSINMLDNMDAITSIITIVVLLFVISLFLSKGMYLAFDLLLFVCLLASLFSFLLIFNWNPSRMYMGDTGTQFLGLVLAVIAITYIWNGKDFHGAQGHFKQFITVVLVFALPIIDTSTVFIKRIMKGSSPFVGGKDHTTHHLSYLGLSDRHVALVFAAIAVFTTAIAFYIQTIAHFTIFHFMVCAAYFLLLFVTLFIIALKPPKVGK